MKIRNEIKIFDESIYNLKLNNGIIITKNQINRTSILITEINKEKNVKNKRINMMKNNIKDIETIKNDNSLKKRNIDIRIKIYLKQIIFKGLICIILNAINDKRRKSIKTENNNISNYISIIINEYIIINIFSLFIFFYFFNISEFSRAIFEFISLIKIKLCDIYKEKLHSIMVDNIFFILELKQDITDKFKFLFIYKFHLLYNYGTIIFTLNCLLNILFYFKKLMNKKLFLQYIFLIDNNIFIFIFDRITKFIKIRIIEDNRKYKRNSEKNINSFGKNKVSNLVSKKEEYKENYIIKLKEKEKININNNSFLLFLIKLLIPIIIFSPIKNNKLDFFYFQLSKITLKIKGVGESDILRNNSESNLTDFLKEVYINDIKQDRKAYKYYFNQTDNYVELIWDDNISICINMFCNCTNITEINLSDFNTSQVKSMNSMFAGCSSLTSLNLSNFDTSCVISMSSMFSGCSSLTSLDLSNFNTSRVTIMDKMFYNCSSLTSLDLSNFNIPKVISTTKMFESCINLQYINLNNFKEKQLNSTKFEFILENAVLCINKNISQKNYFPQLQSIKCLIIDCSSNWKLNQKKIINNTNECIDSCDNSSQYKYEYNGKCYENCSKGFLYDDNNNSLNICKCELDKCLTCPPVALNKNLCTKCNVNYYPKENDQLNLGEYINCYNNPEGYYLDNNFYKKCYYTCKTCNKEGNDINHNCLKCNEKFLFGIKINNYLNCYENCSNYYYFDNDNIFHCTKNLSCPNEYPKLLENKIECIKYNIEDIVKNSLINNENNKTEKSKEIEYYDNILKIIENEFTSENYDTFNIDNGQDDIIKTDKIITTLTTTENQRNNLNNNMTRIDLGECENILRYFYNISINESLYIKKIDIIQDELKTLKVEYNVYAKLDGKNLTKLNLNLCEQNKISIYIPIIINEPLDKLNSSSGYYNDICYTTTSEDGTDILLKDRQKEFIDKNRIICQENCEFSEYDYDTFVAKCSCNVKELDESIGNMNIDKDKILDNFKNIKNFLNFNFLVCYKKLFNKKGIENNIGCYIIFIIIIFHIISIFIFCINQFSSLKNRIKKIVTIKENKKDKSYKTTKNLRINTKKNSLHQKHSKNLFNKKKIAQKKTLNDTRTKIKLKKLENNQININNYIDEEINGLSYDLAKKYDKRTYCQFYASLIKTQHNLICALFNNTDYNSGIIKINLFLIGFTIEYTINALFYNDDTMHKIYESKGDFDLGTQIPIAIYSTIISMIFNYPLNFLALSNDAIINFKQGCSEFKIMKRVKIFINTLFIKFIIYFIISFLFLLFFWYYISMFGVIYKNTQIHLLKDTLMSFGLSLFFPFVIYLFPGIFRILSLSNAKNRQYLYNFSKFLQSF